ncbi:MAG: ribulose-phosphate 3-epimerase [bacterium]|nr:ribulose-phosphate 3-epimerase [bacterium]
MKIVPALLTDKLDELRRMVEEAEFCELLHIDIMDGRFVPTKSITANDLASCKTKIPIEAHLMVENPEGYIKPFKEAGAMRFIFHFEATDRPEEVIEEIKENMEAGLAINPDTSLSSIEHLLEKLDYLLIMSVYPGFYGAKFVPEVLDKAVKIKRLRPELLLGMDGGIKADNIKIIKESGVDLADVGSYIFKADNPKAAFDELKRL